MKNLLLSTAAVFALTSAAYAADINGEVNIDFAETDAGDWGGTMDLEFNIAPTETTGVALGFVAAPEGDLSLDTWTAGANLGGFGIAIGNDNGLFPEAFNDDYNTLATPAMTESIKLSMGDISVAVGFTDWSTDISDISNIQGAYTLASTSADVTVSADYNIDAEDFAFATAVSGIKAGAADVGLTISYDNATSVVGYEALAGIKGITAFINGDDSDAFQNIGGEYVYNLGLSASLTAGAVYNVDAEEITPTVGLTFSF